MAQIRGKARQPISDDVKTFVTRFIIDMFEHGRLDKIDTYTHPRLVLHTPFYPRAIHNQAEFSEYIQAIVSSTSNRRVSIAEVFGFGSRIAIRWRFDRLQTRDYLNLPPDSRTSRLHVMSVIHLRGDKIKEMWSIDTGPWTMGNFDAFAVVPFCLLLHRVLDWLAIDASPLRGLFAILSM